MSLASGSGDIGILLLMAVFGLISWISNKFNSAGQNPPSGTPQAPTPRKPPADSEDERMRRFLEALGIPADAPEPRREVREPLRPQPSGPLPVPPIIARPAPVWPQPQKRSIPAPPPLPRPARTRSLDEEPSPTTSAGRIAVAELAVPSVPAFETISSSVSAVPAEKRAAASSEAGGPVLGDFLRRELGTPEQLRRAFLLREILGPPRGLQS